MNQTSEMAQPSILVVDDDAETAELLKQYLCARGFVVTLAAEAVQFRQRWAEQDFSLVILDVMLPGEDGLSLCRWIRSRSGVPVIMLTASGDETDRVVGLELGADDYVVKPFNARELLARIRTNIRRTTDAPHSAEKVVSRLFFKGWVLDIPQRQLTSPEGELNPLSGGEFKLLMVFCEHANRILSRDQLMDLTLGREAMPFDRSIDVQVGRLRQKLKEDARDPQIIKTHRGEGYLFATSVSKG